VSDPVESKASSQAEGRAAEPDASPTVWRIAIDAMGGHAGVTATVQAAAELSLQRRLQMLLVGDTHAITTELDQQAHNPEFLSVVHAGSTPPATMAPHEALAQNPPFSIVRAMQLLGEGKADALVTAGHPAFAVDAARRHVAMLPGVGKAALCAVVPTTQRHGERQHPFALVVDVGATVYASSDELVSFARMGAAYAGAISKNERPKVALLSTSTQPHLGPPNVVEAYTRLRDMAPELPFDFVGTLEGHHIPQGDVDVIVCDGYTGHVVVRLLDGITESAVALARTAYDRKLLWRVGLSMLESGLQQLQRITDLDEYGGAPLLGFAHPILISHHDSDTRALVNTVKVAVRTLQEGVIDPNHLAEKPTHE